MLLYNGVYVCDLLECTQGCPEGFVNNPFYTGSVDQDPCYPSSFVYAASTLQGFYYFLEVIFREFLRSH